MKTKLILFLIFLIGTLFSCKKDVLEKKPESEIKPEPEKVKVDYPTDNIIKKFYPSNETNQFVLTYIVFTHPLEASFSNSQDTLLMITIDTLVAYINEITNTLPGDYFLSDSKDTLFFQHLELVPLNTTIGLNLKLDWKYFNGEEWVPPDTAILDEFTFSYEVVEDIEHINKITPDEGSLIGSSSFFEIETNLPVDIPINYKNRRFPIKLVIDSVILKTSDNNTITGTINNIDNYRFEYVPTNLPYNQNINLSVESHIEVFTSHKWITLDSSRIIKNINYQTKELVDDAISSENIKSTYPVANQLYFLPKEYPNGIVNLKESVEINLNPNIEYYAIITNNETQLKDSTKASFNEKEHRFEYPLPNFDNSTIYNLKFKAINTLTEDQSIVLDYYFRSSKYNTFIEKFNNWGVTAGYSSEITYPSVYEISCYLFCIENTEYIDMEEQYNLIHVEFDIENSEYYEIGEIENIYKISEDYPEYSVTWRDNSITRPPRNIVNIDKYNDVDHLLTKEMIDDNLDPDESYQRNIYIRNRVQYYVNKDFSDVKNKIVNDYGNTVNTQNEEIINWFLSRDNISGNRINIDYPHKAFYIIPGGTISSQVEFTISL